MGHRDNKKTPVIFEGEHLVVLKVPNVRPVPLPAFAQQGKGSIPKHIRELMMRKSGQYDPTESEKITKAYLSHPPDKSMDEDAMSSMRMLTFIIILIAVILVIACIATAILRPDILLAFD